MPIHHALLRMLPAKILFVIAILFSQSAHAIPWVDRDIFDHGLSLFVGYSSGGDTLNGNVNAGDGISYHLGWFTRFKTGKVHTNLHLSAGLRGNEDNGTNTTGQKVTGSMSVMPIDFIGHIQVGGIKVGGGLTYHLAPSYEETGAVTRTIDFDSQLGYVLSVEFVGRRHFMIGARYNIVEYTPVDGPFARSDTGQSVSKVNGSNLNFYIGLYL